MKKNILLYNYYFWVFRDNFPHIGNYLFPIIGKKKTSICINFYFCSEIITKNMKSNQKGAHSPDMRLVSMGVYPIQKVNSQVVGQDDVSKERLSAFKKNT